MKKITLLFVCCFFTGLFAAQGGDFRVKENPVGGAWMVVGTTEAIHNTDHNAIVVKKDASLNYKKMKVTVRNAPLTITKMTIVYNNGEQETIDIPMEIPKNGESAVVDIKSGTRNIQRIDFWYDSTDFTSGKVEVTVFGRK
ncbi:DUF2541 family protein [Flavobacterium hauense]